MRSQYSEEQRYEEKSRLDIKNVCLDLGWKFRDYDQDNDIDGEIEIFYEVENKTNQINETSGDFVKVQLKATKNINIEKNFVKFACPVKLMHFVDVCEHPIILTLFDVINKKHYWIWLQEYMYTKLDKINQNWRRNISSVSIEIPIENVVDSNKRFKQSIKKISKDGIFEITQLRKKNTLEQYYTLLEEEDSSIPQLRRYSLYILVEKSFSQSKEAMKILIKYLIEKNKTSSYFKNKIAGNYHSEKINILWIFFYYDIRQQKDGLPFCRAEWKDPNKNIKMSILSNPYELEKNIKISWGNYPDIHLSERMTKGEYLKLVNEVYGSSFNIINSIKYSYEIFLKESIDEIKLVKQILSFSGKISSDYKKISYIEKLHPYECSDFDQKINQLLSHLGNIIIYMSNNERDFNYKIWGLKNSLKHIQEIEPELKYEFKKLR